MVRFPAPFLEPTSRRIRVRLGDELVADSSRAQLLVQYPPAGLPTYYLPEEDVIAGGLVEGVGLHAAREGLLDLRQPPFQPFALVDGRSRELPELLAAFGHVLDGRLQVIG